jgi:hypothetical protein
VNTIPNDSDKLATYYLLVGAAQAMTSVFDYLAELQTFELSKLYGTETAEYRLIANTLESIKHAVMFKQNYLAQQINDLVGPDGEGLTDSSE